MNFSRARKTAQSLYEWLQSMSEDPEILNCLDQEPTLNGLTVMPINGIDRRLGVLAIMEAIKCFEQMGHTFDNDKEESWILGLFIAMVMASENDWQNADETTFDIVMHGGIAMEMINIFKTSIRITFDPDRLLLVEILRSKAVDEAKINKYIIRLYRLMLLIAEAGGKVNAQEKLWLDNMMSFRNPEESYRRYANNETSNTSLAESEVPPMEELNQLIGLRNVKKEIENIYNLIKIQNLRKEKGLKASAISYHCVFTGNPGTGKTTVARIVAAIYKELGILEKGHLVETDRSGLVAEYVGQTAVKTNKIVDSALDGVLFIDEAYSLAQGSSNDFGQEAISTLLKRMEDDRNRLVVIIAGYTDEIKQFINANPGLQSRFNRYIHFDDYDADELVDIYQYNLRKYDYRLTPDAQEVLSEVIQRAVANKDRHFGNARFVRNLFEKTLENQARRLVHIDNPDENALTEITAADIPMEYLLQ
ncbi:MAG: AAA family ATPase [Bacteroidales bacterium]|nr:AAA family ATPase [Bacteroidales bacterium]